LTISHNKHKEIKMSKLSILTALFMTASLAGCAGVTQTIAVQPDGTKMVDNSFYHQTAFGTDSRIDVITACNPGCGGVIGKSYAYQSGIGRAILTQVGPSAVSAAGFAVGMNNLRPSQTNISTSGGSSAASGGQTVSSATGGNSAATGGKSVSNAAGGKSASYSAGGNSTSNAGAESNAGAAASAVAQSSNSNQLQNSGTTKPSHKPSHQPRGY
jgi:hypothetical protein